MVCQSDYSYIIQQTRKLYITFSVIKITIRNDITKMLLDNYLNVMGEALQYFKYNNDINNEDFKYKLNLASMNLKVYYNFLESIIK